MSLFAFNTKDIYDQTDFDRSFRHASHLCTSSEYYSDELISRACNSKEFIESMINDHDINTTFDFVKNYLKTILEIRYFDDLIVYIKCLRYLIYSSLYVKEAAEILEYVLNEINLSNYKNSSYVIEIKDEFDTLVIDLKDESEILQNETKELVNIIENKFNS